MLGFMDALRWVIALVLVLAPVAWYVWSEARDRKPSYLWPQMAPALGLTFSPEPATLKGSWNGREVSLIVENEHPVATARYASGTRVRLEIGARAQIEEASGMVVPDRVEFPEDGEFTERYLVRATPDGFGRMSVDPTMRQRLLRLGGVHLLASAGRVDVTIPEATKEAQFRDLFDLAAGVAEAAEHA